MVYKNIFIRFKGIVLKVEVMRFYKNNFFGNFFGVSECVGGGIGITTPGGDQRLEVPH